MWIWVTFTQGILVLKKPFTYWADYLFVRNHDYNEYGQVYGSKSKSQMKKKRGFCL